MARRIVNRMEKRVEYEAYERRQDEDEVEGEEAEEEAEEGDDEEGEEKATAEPAEEVEEAVAPKKRKPAKKKEPKPRTRTRAPKAPPRMKVVWGVFNNSNQRVATFDYPKRKEAEDHAAKLKADKHQTFFVQPIKEPIEEKKE